MKPALEIYFGRMQRVLDYIDQNLDGDLDLETLSGIAAFSKFHFRPRWRRYATPQTISRR
jgi:AraC family transcriptional regulator